VKLRLAASAATRAAPGPAATCTGSRAPTSAFKGGLDQSGRERHPAGELADHERGPGRGAQAPARPHRRAARRHGRLRTPGSMGPATPAPEAARRAVPRGRKGQRADWCRLHAELEKRDSTIAALENAIEQQGDQIEKLLARASPQAASERRPRRSRPAPHRAPRAACPSAVEADPGARRSSGAQAPSRRSKLSRAADGVPHRRSTSSSTRPRASSGSTSSRPSTRRRTNVILLPDAAGSRWARRSSASATGSTCRLEYTFNTVNGTGDYPLPAGFKKMIAADGLEPDRPASRSAGRSRRRSGSACRRRRRRTLITVIFRPMQGPASSTRRRRRSRPSPTST
jgi:hypothetical protein